MVNTSDFHSTKLFQPLHQNSKDALNYLPTNLLLFETKNDERMVFLCNFSGCRSHKIDKI